MFTNKTFKQWLRAKFPTLMFKLHAKSAIRKYKHHFSRMTDAELLAIIKSENKCRGWVTERSFYLYALRSECEKRGKEDWLNSPDSVFHRVISVM